MKEKTRPLERSGLVMRVRLFRPAAGVPACAEILKIRLVLITAAKLSVAGQHVHTKFLISLSSWQRVPPS
jgi:hypothetical protein